MGKLTRSEKKEVYYKKCCELFNKYSKAFLVCADNVASKQMMDMRAGLRPGSALLFGKNTMMKKCLRLYMEETGDEKWTALLDLLVGNVGILFTEDNLQDVREKMDSFRVGAPARANVVAPVAVTIPAGPTGMDPSQTNFFQTLNIATKINKGSIEILQDHVVFKEGEKVSASAAILLAKLAIKPFTYGLQIEMVLENGSTYPPAVLDLSDADIEAGIMAGIRQVAALSLGANYPTDAAMPHIIINAYKNVLAIAVETEYTFEYAEKVKAYLADPSAFAVAAPAAGGGGGGAAAAAPAPEPEEEEEEEDMGFDLFD